jgi:hypothetical protein
MSPIRHRWTVAAAALALGALLGGCSGSGSSEPTASHRTGHHRGRGSSGPTEPTSVPTTNLTSSPAAPVLRFSPKSGGKHLDDCQLLRPGDDPAEFLYYPVLVRVPTSATLDDVTTDHTQGVTEAGVWVAPAGATPETGTFKGWPPASIVTQDSNLNWKQRVQAAGAVLEPSTGWYNVFLRLEVDPTPGDSTVTGIELRYHDADGSYTAGWKATTTFSMSC